METITMADPLSSEYGLEIIFSGLCAFEIEDGAATVLMVNATDPCRFAWDEDLIREGADLPAPHYPRLSIFMRQQVREGHVPRDPAQVTTTPTGEEIGLFDISGEDLTLGIPADQTFQPGSLARALSLRSLVGGELKPLCRESLPNVCVITRIRIEAGNLEVLSVGQMDGRPIEVDFRPISSLGIPSGRAWVTLADRLILRAGDLTDPFTIGSGTGPIYLKPDRRPDGNLEPVRATFSNYHDRHDPPSIAAFDFLWLYELLDTGRSRADLPIPVYTSNYGEKTGSSGVCPPVRT